MRLFIKEDVIQKTTYKGLSAIVVADAAISYFDQLENKTVALFKFLDILIIVFGRNFNLKISDELTDSRSDFGNAFSLVIEPIESCSEASEDANQFLIAIASIIKEKVDDQLIQTAYEDAKPRFSIPLEIFRLSSDEAYWDGIERRIDEELKTFRVDLKLQSYIHDECPEDTNLGVSVVKFGSNIKDLNDSKHRIDNCRWIMVPKNYKDKYANDGCLLAERSLIVPTHINGVPYYEVIFLFQQSLDNIEEWMFRFYRDSLSILNTDLRKITENFYASQISETVSGLGEAESLERLIAEVSEISHASPYPDIVFRGELPLNEKIIGLSDNLIEQIKVDFKDSPKKTSIDDFDRISPSSIGRSIRGAIRELRRSSAEVSDKEQEVFNNIGHILKDVVSVTGWDSAINDVGMIARNFNYFLENEPATVETAINRSAEALKTFSLVQGLGQFISYMKYQVNIEDWEKLSSEVDPRILECFSAQDALSNYAKSIHKIGSIICQAKGWPRLNTKFGNNILPFEDENHFFVSTDYSFPPFIEGSDVSFLFYFYLSEPILNAVKAHSIAARGSEIPIEIELSVHEEDETSLLYTVKNHSFKKAPERISGYKNTLDLLSKFGLSSLNPQIKSTWLPDEKVYEVSVTTVLQPAVMARTFSNRETVK